MQSFRDLYNAQSVEILKGPSALTFGRGVGGGLLNRSLKEADGTRVYDVSAQTGSYWDRRVTMDVGQAVNENFAVRLNMMYENTNTFRDYGKLERYGINPTVTFKLMTPPKSSSATNIFTTSVRPTVATPLRGLVQCRHRRRVSIRQRHSHRRET